MMPAEAKGRGGSLTADMDADSNSRSMVFVGSNVSASVVIWYECQIKTVHGRVRSSSHHSGDGSGYILNFIGDVRTLVHDGQPLRFGVEIIVRG